MFMKLSTFSVYIELEMTLLSKIPMTRFSSCTKWKMQDMHLCCFFFFFFFLVRCWVIVRDLPSLWGDVGEEMWKTPPIEEQGRHAIRGAGDTWAEGRQLWEFKETYSCSKQSLWSNHKAGCQRGVYSNTQFARHTFGLALRFTSMDSKMNDQHENICFNLNHGHHFFV